MRTRYAEESELFESPEGVEWVKWDLSVTTGNEIPRTGTRIHEKKQ